MISKDSIATIVGIFGTVISCGLFVSPLPTFYQLVKSGEKNDKFFGWPYAAAFLNCLIYVLYAVEKKKNVILIINCIGVATELTYMCIAMKYTPRCHSAKIFLSFMLSVGILCGLFLWIMVGKPSMQSTIDVLGWSCVASGVLMYSSTTPFMYQAYKLNNAQNVPIWLTLTGLLNTKVWLIFGVLTEDKFVLIQNSIGLFICIGQMMLWCCIKYRSQKPTDGA